MTGPWVEQHRPKRLDDLVGNPQCVSELRRWAEAWKTGTPRERAVILAGPAGVGKTTAALALAAEMGWQLIELNASDARNATAIERVAGMGSVHQTFSSTGEFQTSQRGQRKLIVLDEADNLYERPGDSSGQDGSDLSDRGGKRAIADVVQKTQQPIILIVNDLYALTKGAGERIAKASLKIQFRRVPAPTVRKFLRDVAQKQGVAVAEEVLEALAKRSEGDLRSALNDLEAICSGATKVEAGERVELGERQRSESAFETVATILKSTDARKAIDAARDLDEPPDFLLAWIDENLPGEYRDPRDLARAYEHLARADVFLGRTLRRQQFGLWGYATELMAGGVATAKSQRYGTPPMYRFPGWIRRMGASKGMRGVRDTTAEKLGRHLHLGAEAFLREQLAPLRRTCLADRELIEDLAFDADLEEEEVQFLLGEDAPAKLVSEIVAHVEARKSADKAQTRVAVHEEKEKRVPDRVSRGRGTSLGDF